MKPLFPVLLSAIVGLPAVSNAAVIISENFGGASSAALNGTTADTFDSGITATGGSSTWVAHEGTNTTTNRSFSASGAVTATGTSTDSSAYLTVGSYINDARGTSGGKFILQSTFTQPTDGSASAWISLGFLANPATTSNFTATGNGYATAILRKSDAAADYYGGSGTGNNNGTSLSVTGTTTFTITLDLTPAGGYNGSTNHGTVYFSRDGGATTDFQYTYTSAFTVSAVGFTANDAANTVISGFSLSQIPEPSGAALIASTLVLGALRRRR